MQWLSKISVRRPIFASVLVLTLVVIGLVGRSGLGVDKFPKVEFPFITITTVLPGASPTDIESDITEKVEEAVNTVSGIDTLSSISTEGASLVIVQFELEKNGEVAAQEVRDRISTISQWPTGTQLPIVQKLDPDAAPILQLAVKAKGQPVVKITEVADKVIKRRLETVDGVGDIKIIGGQKRQINVVVDPFKLLATGVSALEIQAALAANNASMPGGQMDQGPQRSSLRVDNRVSNPQELGRIVVRQQGDHPIRVEDLVTMIEDGQADPDSAAMRDGTPAVVLSIRKQSGTNTVETVDKVKQRVAELQKNLPPGYTLEVVRDNSESIRTAIGQVNEHLILGAILAAIIVLVFLGSLRSTIIAAIAIPVSIIGTFALMAKAGFTMNMMTLLALSLAVGIVIDDAIVVLENIYRWVEENGVKPFPAAIRATKEIGLAVLATTLSLLAVFLPVAFMSGIVGRFMSSFGLTMAFAIALSLIVAFTTTPMLAARLLPIPKRRPDGTIEKTILERIVDRGYHPIERAYTGLLRFCLRHRWVVIAAVFVSCATVPFTAKKAGFAFLPISDDAQLDVFFHTKEGTSLDQTTIIGERIARETRKIPGVIHTLTTVADSDTKQANIGHVYVRLSDPGDRAMSQNEIMDVVRKQVISQVPEDVRASVQVVNDFSIGSGQNSLIQYVMYGPDPERLAVFAKRATDAMKKVPGAVDVDSSVTPPDPETEVRTDRDRAAALGVDPMQATLTLNLLVGGQKVSSYSEKNEQYDVVVRADKRYRSSGAALQLLTVPSSTLGAVALTDVTRLKSGLGPSQLNRLNRTYDVVFLANIAPGYSQGDVDSAVKKILTSLDLPAGYYIDSFGQSKEMGRAGKAFAFAFLLSFVFMYLVLAAQFESWIHPLTIMLALPMTLPFALIAIVLFGNHLDIFSMLGLLVLFAVVKKNGILQVDFANHLRAQGRPRDEAVLEASRARLRPILMTTFAFVAGMLPLVFTNGISSGFSKSIAGIVVGGQTLSLLLTLVAIPVIYTLFDDLSVKTRRGLRRLFRRDEVAVDRGQADLDQAATEA
ncbi:MAG TPA: efflux RND transporter permease subunit [Kofleriaceae bacterium]|nr:efflux RND transporter permease subunit [Kofleriaceae bacterium]